MELSEDKLWPLVLFFYRVDPSNQTQVAVLSGQCLYSVTHLMNLRCYSSEV